MTEVSLGAALVTGGGRRIGRAICLALGRAGHGVAVHHRSGADEAEALVDELRGLGVKAAAIEADLIEAGAPGRLVDQARAAVGPLTVLVNNASLFEDDRVGSLDADLFDRHLAANLKAPILLAEAFAAQVEAPDGRACVVNLLDQRVLKPDPRFFSYALSKAGLWWATRTMAQALAPRVRVNGVGPGPTLPSVHQTQADFDAEAAAIPLERASSPEAIAEAVLYLTRADRVTGQMIAVDGGQHLAWKTPDIGDEP